MRPVNIKDFRQWNERMLTLFDPEAPYRSKGLSKFMRQKRYREVIAALNSQKGERVLEIGFGIGDILGGVHSEKKFGVDLSLRMVKRARKKLSLREAPLVQGDALFLPFKAGSFQKVICSEVLEHILEPGKAVKEISRILAPGGRAVLTVPNESLILFGIRLVKIMGLGKRILGENYTNPSLEKTQGSWHIHRFNKKDILSLCSGKFGLVKVAGTPSRWLPLQWLFVLSAKDKP